MNQAKPEAAQKKNSSSDCSDNAVKTQAETQEKQLASKLTSTHKSELLQQNQKQQLEEQFPKHEEDSGCAEKEPEVERVARKVLDDRYLLIKTIGHGRYAK